MTTIIEGTDAAANASTPYAMAAGDAFFGTLDARTSDWIAVTLTAGQVYSIGAVGIGADRTGLIDADLILHDAQGNSIAFSDKDGPSKGPALIGEVAETGTYYVEVTSFAGGAGDYGLVVTEGDKPSYGVEMGAAILYRAGLTWGDGPGAAATVTWALRGEGPAFDAQGNEVPFAQLTAAQLAAAETALANFSDVCNLTFVQVNPGGTSDQATIEMGAYSSRKDGAGAFAYFPDNPNPGSLSGDLWLNNRSVSTTDLPFGSYSFFAILHELGHAMGLGHPGDYNAAPGVQITYENAAQMVQDSEQYTVMSYFDASATERDMPDSYADTLMMYDIYALQQMYGVNLTTRADATTYGFNSTVGGAFDFTVNTDPLACIWDGGGVDTLDLSGFAKAQRIDLRDGHFSDVGGYKGNLSIALGALIENSVGGSKSDEMIGNDAANQMAGGKGADSLMGGAGDDKVSGNGGADTFVFEADFGRDRVIDFNLDQDFLLLDAAIWGGAAMTAAEVVATYGTVVRGALVLDFGASEIILKTLANGDGLADHILFA